MTTWDLFYDWQQRDDIIRSIEQTNKAFHKTCEELKEVIKGTIQACENILWEYTIQTVREYEGNWLL